MDIKIDLYVIHYNEQRIAPFIINYWKQLPLRKIFIYDNESNDGSLELIKQAFPDKIQVIVFNTNNKFDDAKHKNIKNQEWKKSKGLADFVIVCDFDECLYSPTLLQDLQNMKSKGYTIMKTHGFHAYSKNFPAYSNKLLHEYDEITFKQDKMYSKSILFDPNKIEEINYSPGAHWIKPKGIVKHYDKNIKLLHFKYLSAQYLISNYERNAKRLSQNNKKHHWGSQYNKKRQEIEKIFNDYYSPNNLKNLKHYNQL